MNTCDECELIHAILEGGRALPCDIRMDGAQSLVLLEGRVHTPLWYQEEPQGGTGCAAASGQPTTLEKHHLRVGDSMW